MADRGGPFSPPDERFAQGALGAVVVTPPGWHLPPIVLPGGKSVKDRAVAESYAEEHGMTFVRKGMLDFGAPSLGGGRSCINAIGGVIADGPPGVLCQVAGSYEGRVRPSAQYQISGLGDVVGGLWVCPSGRSLWTRVALPRGYTELMLPSEGFTARYRVAISSDRDEDVARRLLSGEFLTWLIDRVPPGGRGLDVRFEIQQGMLFIGGPIDAFKSAENLDKFAAASARIATEVAALMNSPRR
jgi:hypothetical protein